MRILELYKDHSIPFITEGNKHARDGWVNVHCPFCAGEQDYHLGFEMDSNHFNCWRCGGHHNDQTIAKLLHISIYEAQQLIRQYGGIAHKPKKESRVKINLHPFKYPTGKLELLRHHKKYLTSRGFNPDELADLWDVTGTGPASKLDHIDYSHRVLAPIHWHGRVVSFQTRSLHTDDSIKYLACPMAREEIQHQHILYGNQTKWGNRGVCVEGITDVWRMGSSSFAVFGIDYTPYQVSEICRAFTEVVVVFDPDPQAILQADKLIAELKFRGVQAWREDIKQDPGSMSQDDANHLMKQLLK